MAIIPGQLAILPGIPYDDAEAHSSAGWGGFLVSPRRPAEHSYMAARPGTTRPATDFRSGDFARHSARLR
jgi:hypothetical protein